MTSNDQLLEQYAIWEHWTCAEGQALSAADWQALAKCQLQKASLEKTILELGPAAENEWAQPGGKGAKARAAVRARIEALIALERSNEAILVRQYEAHLQRQTELARRLRKVSRVQRSYLNRATATWQTYS